MTLEARGVSFAYGGRGMRMTALDDVTFALRPCELVGLVGPNGSGKTTLLRAMARAVEPTAGEVLLDGAPLRTLAPVALARSVGYLPQRIEPAPSLTVAEVVMQGRYPHLGGLGLPTEADRRAAIDAMRRLHVEQFADRLVERLSGGERQRALLASALAQGGRFLLLDEPMSALDLHHQAAIFRLLRQLVADAGIGIAIAIHDLTLAGSRCDRLALLAEGRLVAEGTPDEVLREERLRAVYGAGIRVDRHPRSGLPLVWMDETALEHEEREAAPC
jgi:iron complex transport system ATP-binding protein